jgi:hypothetical protein
MSLSALNRVRNWLPKINNQSLNYLLQTIGRTRLLEANEINDLKDAIIYVADNTSQSSIIQIADLTGTGEIGQLYQTDGQLYTYYNNTWLEVGKKREQTYELHIQGSFAASSLWYTMRYDAAANNIYNPLWITGFFDGTILASGFRGWAYFLNYSQVIKNIKIRSHYLQNNTNFKLIYFEIFNNQLINQQILADFTLIQDLAGQIKPILEINIAPINMLENGFFTVAINNNNNPGNIKNLSIYINTEEI